MKFYQALCRLGKRIAKYKLRIPQTYYVTEGKLLAFDKEKGYLTNVEPVLAAQYQYRLEQEAAAFARDPGNRNALDEPAYVFRTRVSTMHPGTYTVKSL